MKLQLENLKKRFDTKRGEVAAINGIDLTVEDKEFFILLGPSGCGKSTLLNLIAGLESPTDGTIYFDNNEVAAPQKKLFKSPKERNVAMVFQNYALYPHMTIYNNIAFPLKVSRTKKDAIDRAVRRAAEQLGLTPLLDRKPGELSGGQRQRVAIARAIIRQPNIFLLDEPLSNLDAQLRTTTRTDLKKLQLDLGITTVYVTHDQVEAMTLGDRIAVINNGKIEQIGTPDDLYNRPANTFVAKFIGSPPMNLIPAEIINKKDSPALRIGDKECAIPESTDKKIPDGHCTIGIRPENVYINGKDTWCAFSAPIHSLEVLGRETLVYVPIDETLFVIVTTQTNLKEGSELQFGFNFEHLFFFSS